MRWLKEQGEIGGEGWIVSGHSVGGTMAVMIGMDGIQGSSAGKTTRGEREGMWGREGGMDGLVAVIALEGIYDFTACRDAHPSLRHIYDTFTTGAFGPEEEGGWERGDVLRCGRGFRDGVEAVVVGHSREDELVEWEQASRLVGVLLEEEGGKGTGGEEVRLMEVEGKHAEVMKEGVAVGKCVDVAIGLLIDKAKAKAKEGR